MNRRDFSTFFLGFSGATLALILFAAVNVLADADGDPASDHVPRVIPYEGTLEFDGGAFTGDIGMRFTIYDDGDNALWSETYATGGDSSQEVSVYAGVFSVLLGQHVDLTTTVLDAEELYVGIEISADDFASSTALAGRQLIGTAPYAMWSGAGANFNVAGDLTVAGGAVIPGAGAHVRLGLNADSSLGSNGPHGIAFGDAHPGDSGLQLVYRTGPNQLVVESANNFTDGADLLSVDADDGSVTMPGGGLTVSGATTLQSTLGVTGATTLSSRLDVNGDAGVDGLLTLGDGDHESGDTLLQFDMDRDWAFGQVNNDSATGLMLDSLTDGKEFFIRAEGFRVQNDGGTANTLQVDTSGNGSVTIGGALSVSRDITSAGFYVPNNGDYDHPDQNEDSSVSIFRLTAGISSVTCSSAHRGRLEVAEVRGDVDALCFCGRDTGSNYRWHCISH